MAKRNESLTSALEVAVQKLAEADTSDEEEGELILEELEESACVIVGLRYSFRGNVPKIFSWYDDVLPNLDEMRFRSMLRCTRKQFNVLLALIEDNPLFHGINSHKQFTVQFQLAIVLYRPGSTGSSG